MMSDTSRTARTVFIFDLDVILCNDIALNIPKYDGFNVTIDNKTIKIKTYSILCII